MEPVTIIVGTLCLTGFICTTLYKKSKRLENEAVDTLFRETKLAVMCFEMLKDIEEGKIHDEDHQEIVDNFMQHLQNTAKIARIYDFKKRAGSLSKVNAEKFNIIAETNVMMIKYAIKKGYLQ